jgi:hypothetical protein
MWLLLLKQRCGSRFPRAVEKLRPPSAGRCG